MGELHTRVPVLYLAPWVDVGGADKGTIDWFRYIDRGSFAPSLITTQPSLNRRLAEVAPYAEEVWDLPQLMRGDQFPQFIFAFILSRRIRLVHVMNSRLGFELLPALAALPDRPQLVVQLHVEEPDRSGYVRYVTTRYGNLVDAFSVSSQALSERLAGYDVPAAKRRVIPTGVDARREFSPSRVRPIEGLDAERFQIVFPARLTAQKDPLLMLDVARRLRDMGVPFQIHVLGDGDQAHQVRQQVEAFGLEREVVMHGDSLQVARWYAACDAVLLTSRFEGLPYVAYEAMAMGVPIVAPRLPGLGELVTADTGVLVSPPREAEPYAAALAALADRPASRLRMGDAARRRVMAEFSLERMVDEHGALYAELLAAHRRPLPGPRPSQNGSAAAARPPRGGFRGRRPGSRPLVSIIVPCFNHGGYLGPCLESIRGQSYHPVETIVVDDGSTDLATLAALDEIERDGAATVLRLPVNRGPGAARNAALERADGRYVLPLDADNLLLPNGVADLVDQLSRAGERVGFIYPNLQFFGNRLDYFEAPSYNLHTLLMGNYCDTSSLIDREVFERGMRYSEHPGLIHEDWEFVLALAERGIYGEPARTPSLLFRKRGFTRSDLVNLSSSFADGLAGRHGKLFAEQARIKAEWNPSLTVIGLDPVTNASEALPNLIAAAHRQSCSDFELILPTGSDLWPTDLGPRLRRLPSALASCRAQVLAQGVAMARGRYVLATYGSGARLLADRSLLEKLLRLFEGDPELAGVALATSEEAEAPLRMLAPAAVNQASLGAVAWRNSGPDSPSPGLSLPSGQPLEALAFELGIHSRVQWRHVLRRDIRGKTSSHPTQANRTDQTGAVLGARRSARSTDERFRFAPPMLPGCPPPVAAILGAPGIWSPPQTRPLCRHLHVESGRYTYSRSPSSPRGCSSPHVLGAVRALPLPGTTSVSIAPDGSLIFGEAEAVDDPLVLGFIEQAPLPLLDQLLLGRHRRSGQTVLVACPSDPLAEEVDDLEPVGFIEPCPIYPKLSPHTEPSYGLAGLVRAVDQGARRHRYAAGHVPPGVPAGELGALLTQADEDRDPLWIDDEGFVSALGHSLSNGRPAVVRALRWSAAPLTWSGFSRPAPKVRATARRAVDSARLVFATTPHRGQPPEPAGYLLRAAGPATRPLYGALHPVTGDQLLCTSPDEAPMLGYRDVVLLGHLVARAPVTGRLGPLRPAAPWTSRFGLVATAS